MLIAYRPGENRRVDKALRLLLPGQRMLDVGCGAGSLAAEARRRFAEVHGVDVSEVAVDLACANGMQARVVDLSSEPLPHPDGLYHRGARGCPLPVHVYSVVVYSASPSIFSPIRRLLCFYFLRKQATSRDRLYKWMAV